MAKPIIGTRLFGWCFPTMPQEQHDKCPRFSFPKENPRECPCECHTTGKKPKKQATKKGK